MAARANAARTAIGGCLLCALSVAQVGITARDGQGPGALNAATPIIGFTPGATASWLLPITATFRTAALSAPVPAPEGTTRVYLPPMQRYALIDGGSSKLRIWDLRRSGASNSSWSWPAHPGSVVFSATGTAVAFVSDDATTAYVIGGLPDDPGLRFQQPISVGETVVAVSDDNFLLLTNNSQNQVQLVQNGTRTALPRIVNAAVFVPHRHELVISDPIAKEIVLLSGVDSGKLAEATITDAQASALAITKDGKILLALDSEHRKLLCLELATGTARQLSLGLPFDSLELLRDGRTFELTGGPEAPVGLVAFTSPNASPSLVMVPR